MRKKIMAVVLSCLTFLALILSFSGSSMRASAVTLDEMTKTAVQIITRSEGTYGSINRNDNGAVSVGILQWHAERAHELMRTVATADPATAKSILGSTFYNEVISTTSWSSRTFTQTEATAASSLLSSSAGQTAQDNLAYQDVQGYINVGQSKYGMTNAGVLVYYAELYNRGSGVAARIVASAKGSGDYASITLSTLHNAALVDKGNSSGYYTERLTYAYNTIVSLGWGDASASDDSSGSSSDRTDTEIDTSDFSDSYAGTYTVTASALNIRSAPSTSASKLGKIPNGATVTVTSGNGSWAAVSYNGISGYCSMEYLQAVTTSVETTAPATTTVPETTTTTTTTTEGEIADAVSATVTTVETTAEATETTSTETVTVTDLAAEEITVEADASTETETTAVAIGEVAEMEYASVYGDVNGDGDVTTADAVMLQKYLGGSMILNVEQLANGDCELDEKLTSTDVVVIMQYLIDRIPELPVA